jgi:hypothetical protein
MKRQAKFWALAVALAVWVGPGYAQDQKQDSQQAQPAEPLAPIQPVNSSPTNSNLGPGYAKRPAPAARGVSSPFDAPYDPSQVTPDTNTLAGAEIFTVGSLGRARNTFDPSITISQIGQHSPTTPGSLPPGVIVQTGWSAISLVNGSLVFNRTWSRYHFTTLYNGGEVFNFGSNSSYFPNHDLVVTQEANFARWRLLLRDDFMAAPGAAFTGSGMGGPGLVAQFSSMLGASLNSFAQAFIPSETIDTGNYAMRYRNAVLGQAEYLLTRRSTVTFAGSYGTLHFSNAGFISSQMVNAQAGYDYQLDSVNSIGILASYGKIDYTGTKISTTDYMAALAYGRKITGRMAFQIAAGPQQIHSTVSAGSFDRPFVSVLSALTYDRRRSGVALSYQRGLTGGSGVLLGATGDTVSASGHYLFTRFWTGSVNGGYALNRGLVPAGAPSPKFSYWYTGANLGRQLGRQAQVNFNYGLQKQNSPTVCPVPSCGQAGFLHTVAMSFKWHLLRTGL